MIRNNLSGHFQAEILLIVSILLYSCSSQEPDRLSSYEDAYITWLTYGRDKKSMRYADFDQINRLNVDQLEVAWIFHSGDLQEGQRGTIQANPLVVGNVMYVTSPAIKIIALNAATGDELWRFDPFEGEDPRRPRGVNRSVMYWEDGDDRRIFVAAGWKPELYALDAESGEQITSFGEEGVIDIAAGIEIEGRVL